ncbi:MAG TPA: Rpn family recombination-promoting nuclease/putative transposase [Myxococcota bacterium]|nr:Rpn family recombination-promoting nuclease/putative transposase [Myxococcota bacterium]
MHDTPEPTGISPRIDCVFKAILGDPARTRALLGFLDAVIQPDTPFVSVRIENPIHLPTFIGDDFTVVDVEAVDASGVRFQIEMQTSNEASLRARMLYTWADIYEGQLVAGDEYQQLCPVISIWILDQNVLRGASDFHHRFVVCDPSRGLVLTDHLEIHTLELARWRARPDQGPPRLRAWAAFFAEAESWATVPTEHQGDDLEEAMGVLHEFKENSDWGAVYRARADAARLRRTREVEMEQALAGRAEAEAATAQAQAEAARAQAEAAQAQAEAAQAQAEAARAQADAERAQADAERAQAEAARAQAEAQAALTEVELLRALLQDRAGLP